MSALLDAAGQTIPAERIAAVRAIGQLKRGTSTALSGGGGFGGGGWGNPTYRGASQNSQELTAFRSPHVSADTANRWNRQIIADRAHDLVRNESHVATAIRKRTGMAIGAGWKLQALPDAALLGITQAEAEDLADQIEREFKVCTDDPRKNFDAARRHHFGGVLGNLHNGWGTLNEVLAVMIYRPDARSPYGTGVQQIDPSRLCNENNAPDTEYLRDGIELDEYGAALRYHIRKGHIGDYVTAGKTHVWDIVDREDENGRAVCIHGFRQQRTEETRGVSFLAPLIEKLAMRLKMERTELQSAVLNATLAAFVKSGFDGEAVTEMLGLSTATGDKVSSFQDQRMSFYEGNPVKVDGITIPILMPGDDVQTNTLGRNPSSFENFNKIMVQNIAATLGVAEGQISGNYGGLNFSTLRGAYNEIWNDIMIDRADFGSQIVQPIYFAVLEEGLANGRITPPASCADLYDEPWAWCQSKWIGPARGYIDPEKEGKGDLIALETGTVSPFDVASGRGKDLEHVYRDRARAERLAAKHGLAPIIPREAAFAPNPIAAPREDDS